MHRTSVQEDACLSSNDAFYGMLQCQHPRHPCLQLLAPSLWSQNSKIDITSYDAANVCFPLRRPEAVQSAAVYSLLVLTHPSHWRPSQGSVCELRSDALRASNRAFRSSPRFARCQALAYPVQVCRCLAASHLDAIRERRERRERERERERESSDLGQIYNQR